MNMFAGCTDFSTSDYTSYEGLFNSELLINVEMIMYNYMMANVKTFEATRFLKIINSTLPSLNISIYNGLISWITGKRMSGEMCTSLGNGFANIIILAYIVSCRGGELIAVVEGDDSLFSTRGCEIYDQDFIDMGMVAKRERHPHVGLASFCGNVFDPEVKHVITDARAAMCKIAALNVKYAGASDKVKLQLIKSKCLSLAHQYPGCPIVSPLVLNILNQLRSITVSKRVISGMQSYKREEYLRDVYGDMPVYKIQPGSRVLMEDAFGITIQEQLTLEKRLAAVNLIGAPELSALMPESWVRNRHTYVSDSFTHLAYNPVSRTPHKPLETKIPGSRLLFASHKKGEQMAMEAYEDSIL